MKFPKLPSVALVVLVATLISGLPGTPALAQDKQVVTVTAQQFGYSPNEITLKKGVPAVLELTTLDRMHGFSCPGLAIRGDINPGKTTAVEFVPQKTGVFPFHCDSFCGLGHGRMTGKITVTD